MSQFFIQPIPIVIVSQEEIKICQGCLLDPGYFDKNIRGKKGEQLKELGIVDLWGSEVNHGGEKEKTATVKHIDNHNLCYNYLIQTVEKIAYECLGIV